MDIKVTYHASDLDTILDDHGIELSSRDLYSLLGHINNGNVYISGNVEEALRDTLDAQLDNLIAGWKSVADE